MNSRIKLKYLVLSLVLALLLTLGNGCITVTQPQPAPAPGPAPTENATPIDPNWKPSITISNNPQLPDIADVVSKVKPSVVAIDVEVVVYDIFNRPFTQSGAGSGWVIDSEGIIVTNNHVVEGAKTVTVTLDNNETYEAKQIHTDPLTDLAVIKIDARNLSALKIGDPSFMRVGDWVIAIGNALGEGISATNGIISRKDVSIEVDEGQTLYDLIQTNAAINPGNSGGPLVNLAGEVIGITSAKLSAVGVEGMGYAISSNAAMPIIKALINNGYVVRPWMGVVLDTVNQVTAMFNRLSVDEGALITQLAAGSPADLAGLREGDVIVSVDDKQIASAQELIQEIHSRNVGQSVKITYWREANKETTFVTLIERPAP